MMMLVCVKHQVLAFHDETAQKESEKQMSFKKSMSAKHFFANITGSPRKSRRGKSFDSPGGAAASAPMTPEAAAAHTSAAFTSATRERASSQDSTGSTASRRQSMRSSAGAGASANSGGGAGGANVHASAAIVQHDGRVSASVTVNTNVLTNTQRRTKFSRFEEPDSDEDFSPDSPTDRTSPRRQASASEDGTMRAAHKSRAGAGDAVGVHWGAQDDSMSEASAASAGKKSDGVPSVDEDDGDDKDDDASSASWDYLTGAHHKEEARPFPALVCAPEGFTHSAVCCLHMPLECMITIIMVHS